MFRRGYRFFMGRANAVFRIFFPKWYYLILFLVVILPPTVSYGGDDARLTVMNSTDHYLHIIIDGNSNLYISPGRRVMHETEGPADFVVNVFYSPGQRIAGSRTRIIRVSPFKRDEIGCWLGGDNAFGCSVNPASSGAALWEVTPDSLQVEPQQ